MDEKLKSLLAAATDESLFAWTDPKMVGRAYGYLEKVDGLSFIEGQGVVAKIHGSKDYYARVFCDESGNLESVCSCPVGHRCKHAVAAILTCAKKMSAGEPIDEEPCDGAFATAANAAMAQVRARIEKREAEAMALRQAEDAREEEWRRRNEADIGKFKAEFQQQREKVLRICADGHVDDIIDATELFLRYMRHSTVEHNPSSFEDEYAMLDPTVQAVIPALRKSGASVADILVWAVRATRPYGDCDATDTITNLLSEPQGEYADPKVWREVAERLQRQMDEFPDDASGGEWSALWHQAEAIRDAWLRAGDERKAAGYLVKYVSRVHNWKEVAEFLNRYEMYDEAINVARAGIAASRYTSDYGNDYCEMMQEPLADAFAGKGDHAKAAAILAEQFLDWMGCYEYHRSVESFRKVLDEAEKAGVREAVRTALVHALKTGVNPLPLQEWKAEPEKEDFPWKRLPKRVSYQAYDALSETPPWPLPRANEGVLLFELRWDTTMGWCQFDQEFLLKLDIEEGDREKVALRFCDLPEYPKSSDYYQHDVEPMIAAVKRMMEGFRPDIVEVINDPRRHWSSPAKNPLRMR